MSVLWLFFGKIKHPWMVLSSEDIRLRVEIGFRIKFHIKAPKDFLISELKKLIDTILRDSYQMRIPSYTICTQDGFGVLEILKVGDILEDGQRIHIDPFSSAGCFSISCNEQLGSDMHSSAALSKESNIKGPSNGGKGDAKKSQPRRVGVERKKAVKKISKSVDRLQDAASKDEPMNTQSISVAATEALVGDSGLKNPENIQNKDEKISNEKSVLRIPEDDAKPEAVHVPESTSIQDKVAADKRSSETPTSTSQPPNPDNFKGFVVRESDLTKKESSKFEEQGFFKPLKKKKTEEDTFEIL